MNSIFLKARAKINLTLNILNKRDDGYHNLESVFQKINLFDELYIVKTNDVGIFFETNVSEINNENNIICKAYYELKKRYNMIEGVYVKLNKKIPIQAGLGGGSTDCASFILGMNKLFKLNMSHEELSNICKNLGSDVVPCLYDGVIKVTGKGELVEKIDSTCKYYILIVKPNFSCSTSKMYEKIDEFCITQSINTVDMINALVDNDLYKVSMNLYNVFEQVIEEHEIVSAIKKELIVNGALGALMSGSGSCIYGIFSDRKTINDANINLRNKYITYICNSYNK